MDPQTKNWLALVGMGVAAYVLFRRRPPGPPLTPSRCGCGVCAGPMKFQATTYQYPEVYTRDAEDLAVSSRRLVAKYPEVLRF